MNKTGIEYVDYTWNPVTGCQHGCEYCLSPDTEVLLSNGRYEEIGSIAPGDKLVGVDGSKSDYSQYVKTKVLDKWYTQEEAYQIVLENGTTLICSKKHRWLSNRGWKYTIGNEQGKDRPHLTTNNYLMGPGKPKSSAGKTSSQEYKRGYISGMFEGDGHIGKYDYSGKRRDTDKQYHVRLALKDKEALERTQNFLEANGVSVHRFKFDDGLVAFRTHKKKDYLKVKKIIKQNKNSSKYKKGWIAGIYDAEGSNDGNVIRFSNSDKSIINRIVEYLMEFDFTVTLESKSEEVMTVRLKGGKREKIRFFNTFRPSINRKTKVANGKLKTANGRTGIRSIEKLNKKITMVDIMTETRNFIAEGVVSHNCYARRLAENRFPDMYPNGFEYTFWEDRLDEPIGAKPSSILVSSMGDLFGEWVSEEDIQAVAEVAKEVSKHNYLFLTKNPGNMWYKMSEWGEVIPPDHFWFGTSVEGQESIKRVGQLPATANTFVSFEPLLGKIKLHDLMWELGRVNWVIIGAKTGPNSRQPKREWVQRILFWADDHDVPVFMKDNLNWPVEVQQFPQNYRVPRDLKN